VTLFEFCRDLQHQKTGVPGLSCGTVSAIIHLAISVEHQLVTDTTMLYIAPTWRRTVKSVLDFNEARDDGVAVASAGLYANHLHLALDR